MPLLEDLIYFIVIIVIAIAVVFLMEKWGDWMEKDKKEVKEDEMEK